jgi:hypothetical protein
MHATSKNWNDVVEGVCLRHPTTPGFSKTPRGGRKCRDFLKLELARLVADTPLLRFSNAPSGMCRAMMSEGLRQEVPMRQLFQGVVVVLWSALPIQAPTAQAPTYDAFMQQTVPERIHVFNLLSPEERAELVRTHSTRWLTANSARLSVQQISVMRENIAFVKADGLSPRDSRCFCRGGEGSGAPNGRSALTRGHATVPDDLR